MSHARSHFVFVVHVKQHTCAQEHPSCMNNTNKYTFMHAILSTSHLVCVLLGDVLEHGLMNAWKFSIVAFGAVTLITATIFALCSVDCEPCQMLHCVDDDDDDVWVDTGNTMGDGSLCLHMRHKPQQSPICSTSHTDIFSLASSDKHHFTQKPTLVSPPTTTTKKRSLCKSDVEYMRRQRDAIVGNSRKNTHIHK